MIRRVSVSRVPAELQLSVSIDFVSAPCGAASVDISCCRRFPEDLCHPHQVVRCADNQSEQLRSFSALESAAAHSAHRFAPAKDLLDAFAQPLTDGVADMPSRTPIDS